MQANIGTGDKIFRIVLGLVLIILGVVFKTWWGAIGVLPLVTSFVSFCPLYALIGVKTIRAKSTSA